MSQRQRSGPGNVPVELTSFVGRVRELAEVKRLLAAARVVTLAGPGGIGKSRLALRAANQLGRFFQQGVWLAELAELDDPDLVPVALARAMGVYDRPEGSIGDALVAHLRERRLLVVLDNCEHLLAACRELVTLLVSRCAGVRVLCTSRERLGVPGEVTVVLPVLEVPAAGARPGVAGLAEVEALRLLVDRAVAVAPGFVLTEENCGAAGALACFEEARRVSAQAGADRERAYALMGLGLVRLRLGETELGAELLAASRETMTRLGDAFGRAQGLYFSATALAAAGRLAGARRLALEGLDASDRAGNRFGRGNLNALLGIVEWLSGDPGAAEARIKEAVRILDRIGHRWGMALSLEGLAWAAGSSGRPERAALLLGASAALWHELGNALPPYWQAQHDGCEAAARAGLGEDRYRACRAEGHALGRDRAVAAALEDEGTVPAARPAPAAAAAEDAFELSARELEVARLVADGLSNPAIAAALFVSVATVKTHVSHILAKLGLDSRTQLARWVAGHDLGPPAPAHR